MVAVQWDQFAVRWRERERLEHQATSATACPLSATSSVSSSACACLLPRLSIVSGAAAAARAAATACPSGVRATHSAASAAVAKLPKLTVLPPRFAPLVGHGRPV